MKIWFTTWALKEFGHRRIYAQGLLQKTFCCLIYSHFMEFCQFM